MGDVKKSKNKYSHVKSKVSQYIKDIKKQEAKHKRDKEREQMHESLNSSTDKSDTNNELLDDLEYLENDLLNKQHTIDALFEERQRLHEQFEMEKNKVLELQINFTEKKQQKMIDKLDFEPCECWQTDQSIKQTAISNLKLSDSVSLSDIESEQNFNSTTDSTSYKKLPCKYAYFYQCDDSTSYKDLKINNKTPSNFDSTKSNNCKFTYFYQIPNRIRSGQKIRKSLIKTFCLVHNKKLDVCSGGNNTANDYYLNSIYETYVYENSKNHSKHTSVRINLVLSCLQIFNLLSRIV